MYNICPTNDYVHCQICNRRCECTERQKCRKKMEGRVDCQSSKVKRYHVRVVLQSTKKERIMQNNQFCYYRKAESIHMASKRLHSNLLPSKNALHRMHEELEKNYSTLRIGKILHAFQKSEKVSIILIKMLFMTWESKVQMLFLQNIKLLNEKTKYVNRKETNGSTLL